MEKGGRSIGKYLGNTTSDPHKEGNCSSECSVSNRRPGINKQNSWCARIKARALFIPPLLSKQIPSNEIDTFLSLQHSWTIARFLSLHIVYKTAYIEIELCYTDSYSLFERSNDQKFYEEKLLDNLFSLILIEHRKHALLQDCNVTRQ